MNANKCIKMLSLDTSTRNTGYGLFENGILKEFGVLSVKSKEPLDNMLFKISILLNNHSPDIVVVENTVVLRNARIQRDLTEIIGGIRFWCVQEGSFFCTLNPTEWRRLVKDVGENLPKNRTELKAWSVKKASEYVHKQLKSNDVSDAVLIGVAYINLTEQKGEAI